MHHAQSKSKHGTVAEPVQRCPNCTSRNVVRKGHRKNKHETVQLFRCADCRRYFTSGQIRGKVYPLTFILEAVSLYNQGFSMQACTRQLKERYGLLVSDSSIGAWVKEYRELCTYGRLRDDGRALFSPHQITKITKLYHRQIYEFSIHRAKLDLLINRDPKNRRFAPLAAYLQDMLKDCPHALFRDTDRASSNKTQFDLSGMTVSAKQNFATRIAGIVLPTVKDNKRRHETLQRFMLLNDSVTVAVEVPIFFLPEDLAHMQKKLGFKIPVEIEQAITGHIDFIQVRNGAIHILDYKPDAPTNKPIQQLTIYALALSRLTGLRLFDFKCAWFNQDGYFEFFPLHVVHKLHS